MNNRPERIAILVAVWPAAASVLGMLLLIAGFVWPEMGVSRTAWADLQAKEYTDASAALHSASHGHRSTTAGQDDGHQRELQAARDRFDAINEKLDVALQGPAETAFWLKVCGGLLVGAAAAAVLARRSAG